MTDPTRPPAVVAQADATLAELAAEINREHEGCEASLRAGVRHALQAGRLLAQAKARLPHGGWLPWLRENCAFSERTAQGYMKLAKGWPAVEGKAQRVADLSYREALGLLREADREGLTAAEMEGLKPLADTIRADLAGACDGIRGMATAIGRIQDVLTPERFDAWLASRGWDREDAEAVLSAAASEDPASEYLRLARWPPPIIRDATIAAAKRD